MVWAVSLSTMKLIPHCLTATLLYAAIWSLIEFGNLVGPLAHSELYLRHKTRDAAPKCISRRTSYLRVRLAFHPYPQLIQAVFNRHWFGPPLRVTAISSWPWVDHPVSGLLRATNRTRRHALFGLAFASAPSLKDLTLQRKVTRRLILQKARRQAFSGKPEHSPPTACKRHGFRYYFTPLPGCFSPFPRGTSSLSVAKSI